VPLASDPLYLHEVPPYRKLEHKKTHPPGEAGGFLEQNWWFVLPHGGGISGKDRRGQRAVGSD